MPSSSDGRRVFVKTHPRAPRTMFGAEARGLGWLREAGALRIPEVLAVSEDDAEGPLFLALEYIESRPATSGFDEALGRGLAEIHRFGAPSFGLDHDNFIGSLEQANGPRPTWPAFYREQRLEPQLRRATDQATHRPASAQRFRSTVQSTRIARRARRTAFPAARRSMGRQPPHRRSRCALPHRPCSYGGHREVDLAMMRLFGGFGARVFDAYGEAWPLAPGADKRIPLYQLYPLLVHVNLFGGGYVDSLSRTLEQALRAD